MFQCYFLILLFSLHLLIPGLCLASDWYTDPQKGQEGWYGYEVYKDKETEPENNDTVEIQAEKQVEWPTMKEAMGLNATVLGHLIKKAADVAIGKPTEANVMRWVEYMDVARTKSLHFANVAAWVRQNNPQFNTAIQSPYNYSGRLAAAKARLAGRKKYIGKKADEIAVLLFVSQSIPLSDPARKILEEYCKNRGLVLRIYDMDIEDSRLLAESLGVNAIPQAWVISKKGYTPFPIMTGTTSESQIELALYRGLRVVSGDTPPKEYADPLPVTFTASKEVE